MPNSQGPIAGGERVEMAGHRFTVVLAEGGPAPTLIRAMELLVTLGADAGEDRRWLWLAGGRAGGMIALELRDFGSLVALELWDFESWHALTARQVQVARDMGALVRLQFALNFLAGVHLLAGELSAAARLVEEDRLIAEATGNPPVRRTVSVTIARAPSELSAPNRPSATAAELSGTRTEVIHLVGGGARNALLCALAADACALPVVAGPVEAAAYGNVLVQARTAGFSPVTWPVCGTCCTAPARTIPVFRAPRYG